MNNLTPSEWGTLIVGLVIIIIIIKVMNRSIKLALTLIVAFVIITLIANQPEVSSALQTFFGGFIKGVQSTIR